jgi:hypothetical protein
LAVVVLEVVGLEAFQLDQTVVAVLEVFALAQRL